MGEVPSKTSQINCLFYSEKECPVRKEMRSKLDAKDQISKYVKPMGDEELLKIFTPLIEKLEQSFHSEFGILHFYCAQCPIKFKEISKGMK